MKKQFKSNDQGQCPLCDSESIEYGSSEVEDDGMSYEWTCENCGATGKEWYSLQFDSHGNVQDKDGKEILNEEGY
jgi:transcription elongation factor Elf1